MRLNQREIAVISTGIVVLIFLGGYFLLMEPLMERRDKLKVVTARLEKNLIEIQQLAAEYKSLNDRKDRLRARVQARGAGFAPFSYLETLARQSGLGTNIESMTPLVSTTEEGQGLVEFEVRLSKIGLNELIRFLYRIETSDKVLLVYNLHIRPRYLTPDRLDVTLRVATPAST